MRVEKGMSKLAAKYAKNEEKTMSANVITTKQLDQTGYRLPCALMLD